MHLSSPVSGVASVAERGGPDRYRSDRNRKNPGLPAAGVHSHGWTTCVSRGGFKYVCPTVKLPIVCFSVCLFPLTGLELSGVVQACWC